MVVVQRPAGSCAVVDASSPGSLVVVALDAAGLPRIAFQADTFQLTRIDDTAGRNALVGYRDMAEQEGHCVTYNPPAVVRFAFGLAAM